MSFDAWRMEGLGNAAAMPCPAEQERWNLTLLSAAGRMDDGLRRQVHEELAPCDAESFLKTYAERHEKLFDTPFVWSHDNGTTTHL